MNSSSRDHAHAATGTRADGGASYRLTKALDIATLYSGGMTFGETREGNLMFSDIRDLIDSHAALLAALFHLRLACRDRDRSPSLSAADRYTEALFNARDAIAKALGAATASPSSPNVTDPGMTSENGPNQ